MFVYSITISEHILEYLVNLLLNVTNYLLQIYAKSIYRLVS